MRKFVRATWAATVALSIWTAGPAAAQFDLQAEPNTEGLPARSLLVTFYGWALWLGLFACAVGLIYGGATYGWDKSKKRAEDADKGPKIMAGCAIGACVIGLAGTFVNGFYSLNPG